MINQAKVFVNQIKLFVDMDSFGKWLRECIRESGLSNAEVGRRVGVSGTHIGNLVRDFSPNTKNGIGKPSPELAEALANLFKKPVDEALVLAGYAPRQTNNIFNIGLDENVRLSLFHGSKFTEDEREEFIEAFNVAYEIAKRRVEQKRKNKEE